MPGSVLIITDQRKIMAIRQLQPSSISIKLQKLNKKHLPGILDGVVVVFSEVSIQKLMV